MRSGAPARAIRETVRSNQLPRYFLRCLIGIFSMFCGFWAIGNLPLSQAISLAYSSPIFVTIAAALWLGKPCACVAGWRWRPASSACW